ncbi:MAG: hypothetical protein FWF20_11390 [Betaproteobacteria bacterium]|nr:hypothetical protein [Betaproteobacteria bacterium]MCL2887356.1 hypothetical protein [Betaproteobacteria bacterium]
MSARRPTGILDWLKSLCARPAAPVSDIEQARRLLAAIDRGGIPLNPARVNAVARNLGLEVAKKARVEDTIARLRAAVHRAG